MRALLPVWLFLALACTPREGPSVPVGASGRADDEVRACTSDRDCAEGFSCWRSIPRGPMAGVRGSVATPGRCFSDDVIRGSY